jgi:hypothetical protein
VYPDPNPDLLPLGRLLGGQRTLDLDRCRDGVGGSAEGDEEGVPLGVDHLAPVGREHSTQQPLLLGQQLTVPSPSEPLEQTGRALDVREQEGDSAA